MFNVLFIEVAIYEMALLFRSVRLGVGRPIILEAVVVIRVSLVLFLTDNILKKQVEQYRRMDWIMLWYRRR